MIPLHSFQIFLEEEFSSMPCFNSCKMIPLHSFQIFVYANSFEKLLQYFHPFCILFICLHFPYQCTNLKFPYLPFGCQNPSSCRMSLSQVFFIYDFTKYNHAQIFLWICTILFCSIYSFHNSTLLLWVPHYVSNLTSWKTFVNDFNSMVKIHLCYIFIFVNTLHFPHNVF